MINRFGRIVATAGSRNIACILPRWIYVTQMYAGDIGRILVLLQGSESMKLEICYFAETTRQKT